MEKSLGTWFHNPRHRAVSSYLQRANSTGKLGEGPSEGKSSGANIGKMLWQSFPTFTILGEVIWSSFVLGMSYLLSLNVGPGKDGPRLGDIFWMSKLNVSPTVSLGVGWALFVLLGFYVREASSRYYDAQCALHRTGVVLRRVVRAVRQCYPAGTWHVGDRERILAHLVAYPIALKMSLRAERDPSALQVILHEKDADDVVRSDCMHAHCLRVVRSYITSAEDDGAEFPVLTTVNRSPPGTGVRRVLSDTMDAADSSANTAVRIAEFRPAIAYINHLRLFLYIWMMFLPLALVKVAGWFTVLWSVLFTYIVSMLFVIARALDEPFGFDEQDIKLNHVCSELAHEILVDGFAAPVEFSDVIDADHTTPPWLEEFANNANSATGKPQQYHKLKQAVTKLWNKKLLRVSVLISMLLYVAWCVFIVFLTWELREKNPPLETRWWKVYIPLNSSSTSYVSLCVFILLGFWLSDAYGRYWRALQLWKTEIQPKVSHFAFEVSMFARHGLWHQRDRERILSHLVALPYALMLDLRDSRDVSVLSDVLAPKDLATIASAPRLSEQVLHVIHAYLNSADMKHMPVNSAVTYTFGASLVHIQIYLPRLDDVMSECEAIRRFPISSAFTLHLQLITVVWLAMLPLTLVVESGFVSFLYLVPIGYSVFNLLAVGKDLSDPFGTDDDDLPLEQFCNTIKTSIAQIYCETVKDVRHFVRPSLYHRSSLLPRRPVSDPNKLPTMRQATIMGSVRNILNSFPSVPAIPLAISVIWSVIAVFVSRELSELWPEERREACQWWCSPIDVSGSVLGNIGFALFMILAFRASDALNRYDDGAKTLNALEMHLRTLGIEIVQAVPNGTFHAHDTERIIAHLAQVPLCFRDILLSIDRNQAPVFNESGVLNDEDRKHFEQSAEPLEHLLKTVEGYFLTTDMPNRQEKPKIAESLVSFMITFTVMMRMFDIRHLIAQAMNVKRYPVVSGYRRHQYVFAAIWLALLPLAIVSYTGYLTILWTFLISYAVLGMEEIALRLVDPFGLDAVDLPVSDICEKLSSEILEAVSSVGWDCDRHVRTSVVDEEARLGTVVSGSNVFYEYSLASPKLLRDDGAKPSEVGPGPGPDVWFAGPREVRTKPTLFAHFLHSVPWWILAAVTAWTCVACIISHTTRDRMTEDEDRWWQSFISIDGAVGNYVSVAAFTLLGFYVRAAFGRYFTAGKVWGGSLRGYCRALASQFLSYWPEGEVHDEDHRRVIGHIAALPLALKAELRHSRDMRDAKGLVSSMDLARIHYAPSMSGQCIDVIRAYFYKVMARRNTISSKKINPSKLMLTIRGDVMAVENIVQAAICLKKFDIAPAFIILLNTLLLIWFIILPFVLAEVSGWFTILWVPIISYGIFGMHHIATELQHPYGNDLNDLDLDRMADEIVADVLECYHLQPGGFRDLIMQTDVSDTMWKRSQHEDGTALGLKKIFSSHDEMSWVQRFMEGLRLALFPVPWWLLTAVAVWSTLMVLIAYLVSKHLPLSIGNADCQSWFCSAIAVDEFVKEYIGFALFLLLGFRLNDSHNRFTLAAEVWQERVVGMCRLTAQRLFASYENSTWHNGDLERVAGHMAAYAVCLMSALRDKDYGDRLDELLSREDAAKVLSVRGRADYCIEVLRGYLVGGEAKAAAKLPLSCNSNDFTRLLFYVRSYGMTSFDCAVMRRVPMPFGYVQHLRIFLTIWLALLPLGLVESSGWATIAWVVIIAYGVIGIERWAEQLADPFGFDVSDVPLEKFCDRITAVVRYELGLFRCGLAPFLVPDRPPFPDLELNAAVSQDINTINPKANGDLHTSNPKPEAKTSILNGQESV